MSSSTTWSDSNLLSRMDARRRQRLSKQTRPGSAGYAPLAVAFVLGLVIGLPILGWWLWPIKLGNSTPSDLAPAFREAYVAMVADSYALNGDLALAEARLSGMSEGTVAGILDGLKAQATEAGSPVQAKRLEQIRLDLTAAGSSGPVTAASQTDSTAAPAVAGPAVKGSGSLLPIGLLLLAGLALVAGGFVVYRQAKMPDLSGAMAALRALKLPRVAMPTLRRRSTAAPQRAPEPARTAVAVDDVEPMEMELSLDQAFSILADEIDAEDEPRPSVAGPATRVATTASVGARSAVGNYMVTYRHGAAEPFDTSHSIETDTGEFLGECGVGVAETLGDASPERVCAMEIWLFDKSDIRTTTKSIVTDYAMQDPETRSAVTSRGDVIHAQTGQSFTMETAGLTLKVDVVGLVYSESPDVPPKSYFQELVLEMTAVQK